MKSFFVVAQINFEPTKLKHKYHKQSLTWLNLLDQAKSMYVTRGDDLESERTKTNFILCDMCSEE